MSLTNSNRIPIPWSNVDVFTFGKSSLYGYDSLNHCLIVQSLIELNNILNGDHLHLSSSPSWPIRRLILNEDETILALLADKVAYLVYLPQSNIQILPNSPSKGSRLCQLVRIPPTISSLSTNSINYSLIDFIWLTSNNFVIVYSIPSSSECHLYKIHSLKQDGIEYIQTFSVGFSSTNKKISLHQSSDIIKLDKTQRKENDIDLIYLYAMKTDGDIFLLEINRNELLSKYEISGEFQGPIRILPSTFDNYGADHSQSTFICLSNSISSLIVFTHNKYQLNQCILLSPSLNQYYFYTIDLITLPKNSHGQQILTSIISDPYSSNRYFISDLNGNIYLIDILWINQIQYQVKYLKSTNIQHIINGNNLNNKIIHQIEQMNVIQTTNHEQYLAVIIKLQINQEKELILVRLPSLESKSNFVNYIRSLVVREKSIPYITLSTRSINISDIDFKKNLLLFIDILTEQYIKKQEKIYQEIQNKQRYLNDFQQTQFNEVKQFNEKFQRIQNQFQILQGQYQKEYSRRQRLSTHVDDLLSIIEQNTPVLSDAEIRMQQQLETYQIQINYLKEKIQLLQEFISSNQNQEDFDHLTIENIQNYVQDHRIQIDRMKKRLETIQINK